MLESCCRWPGERCAISTIAVAARRRSASGSTLRIFLPPTSIVETWSDVSLRKLCGSGPVDWKRLSYENAGCAGCAENERARL